MKKIGVMIALCISLGSLSFASNCLAADIDYLLTASSKGDLASVNAMLESGANVNIKDENDITALMYAARKNRSEVALSLINKGADINAKDKGGWTPLMFKPALAAAR